MKRHFALTKAQQQADWLAAFSEALIHLDPSHAGRIDWDTAKHLYFKGRHCIDAAHQYINSHKEDQQ